MKSLATAALASALLAAGPAPSETEHLTPPGPGERQPERLKVGDPAPDFTLPDPSGLRRVRLASFRGRRPVVLVFGSLT